MNPHGRPAIRPTEIAVSAWKNRDLIWALTGREIRGRYKGSLFGIVWSFLNPALMLLVFTFVFGEIFKARWGNQSAHGGVDFAVALFSGLLIYNFFAECMAKAPGLIVGNANYVKKVVFPLETLAIVTLLSSLFHLGIAYLILVGLLTFSGWSLGWSVLLAPVVFLPFVCLVLGLTWLFSALGVFVRDIGQLIAPAITATLFLSPVFYPLSSVSERFRWLYHLNPLTLMIEQIRGLVLHHQLPDLSAWFAYSAISLLILMAGFVAFQKLRQGFADVL